MNIKLSAALFFLLLSATPLFPQIRVVYPNINGIGKDSFGYAVLKLALDKSGVDYDLSFDNDPMTNERIREQIKNGKISVADFGTSPLYEMTLQAIYYPIDLGLNGWRLMAIRKDRQDDFRNIGNIEDLTRLTAGQGQGWSDTEILRKAGLQVVEAPHIDNLFRMLNAGRFDYFPLGANEILSLLTTYRSQCPDVIVEKSLVLVYPFGRLFFVRRDNIPLANALNKGMKKAMEDGSFLRLFRERSSARDLEALSGLNKRTKITIDNPFMTKAFRNIPRKYFYPQMQP